MTETMAQEHDDPLYRALLSSFAAAGGIVSPSVSLTQLPSQGRCCVAREDIPEDHDLFVIPRMYLLNISNSLLPSLCKALDSQRSEKSIRGEADMSIDSIHPAVGDDDSSSKQSPDHWQDLSGWSPLILCMMWETWRTRDNDTVAAAVSIAKNLRLDDQLGGRDWKSYLEIMPTDFSSMPMFWPQQDLDMLKGTDVLGRIGKAEAEAEYRDNVRPFIASHAAVFLGPATKDLPEQELQKLMDEHYGLEQFHVQGSRILSRSFHVKKGHADEGTVVGADGDVQDDEESDEEDDDEDEEREDTADISMVPFADLLNASYASENAKLFYSSTALIMRSTRAIKQGEQIMNTYGDPPNADLLRRYGYVDEWNAGDEVELDAAHLAQTAASFSSSSSAQLTERVSYLVSQGLEESFVLTYPFPPSDQEPYRPQPESPSDEEVKNVLGEALDEELLSTCRALLMGEEEFEAKYRAKEKVPKPKLDEEIAHFLIKAIEARLGRYEGGPSSKEDEEILYGAQPKKLGTNARNAIVVRLGEKRVLEANASLLRRMVELEKKQSVAGGGEKKRKDEGSKGKANGGAGGIKKIRR